MVKRILDLIIATGTLIFFSPVLIVVGFLIKIKDGDPIFYRGLRVGQHGICFYMLKFRTMVTDADKIGGPSTPNNDPRLTGIGAALRKYKIDEIPQLINVLKGDMSLVGPRPEVPQYVELYSHEEKKILTVRPGITDWASLWNSDEGAVLVGTHDPEQTYLEKIRPTKIRLQLEYIHHRSLMIDLAILIKTIYCVILKKPSKSFTIKLEDE